jgi:hypothetical protein
MRHEKVGCAVWLWRVAGGWGKLDRANPPPANGHLWRRATMLDQRTAEESQARLLHRIAAQDRQALAEFYDQTAAVLFSTAVRILGDAHEAEEVVQDVFVQIWNKAATFDEALGAPFHWALGITRNRSIDRLRARQRRGRVLEELTERRLITGRAATTK